MTRRAVTRRARIRLGIGSLVALAVVTYAIFARELPGTHHWTLNAIVSDSTQIRPGSPARIAGVKVGTVADVKRGPGATALLELHLDEQARPLRDGTTLALRPRLFLEGSYYADLHPGPPAGAELEDGDTLPLPQTSVPVSFTTLLTAFDQPVREGLTEMISGAAEGLRDGGAEGLRDGITALGPALRDGAIALQAASGTQPRDVADLVAGSARVVDALAADAPALGSALANGNRVAAALAAQEQDLTATVRQADAVLREAPPTLTAVAGALPALRQFAGDLTPALNRAPAALDGAADLLDQLRGLAAPAELPRLAAQVRPVARGIVSFAPPLRALLPRVRRVTDCVSRQGSALLNVSLDDGALSAGQTLWQELAHVSVNLASLSQNFDAAGSWVRFNTVIQPNLVSLGSVPGVGVLLRDTTAGTIDQRPDWNGPAPPALHPEVPCGTQPTTEFQAPARTDTRATHTVRGRLAPVTPETLHQIVKRLKAAR